MQWKPEIEFRDPKSLTPYVKNAKVHSTEQIDKIAGQIAAVGFTQPIVVDREGVIIAGHGRREAALRLALNEVPVVVAGHLDEYQAMAARIADNKVADSPWDTNLLKFDLGTLELKGFDIKLTGFNSLYDLVQTKIEISAPTTEDEEESPHSKPKNKRPCPHCGMTP